MRHVIQTKNPKSLHPLEIFVREQEDNFKNKNLRVVLEGPAAEEWMDRVMKELVHPLEVYTNYQENKILENKEIVPLKLVKIGDKIASLGIKLIEIAKTRLPEESLKERNALVAKPRAYRVGELDKELTSRKVS